MVEIVDFCERLFLNVVPNFHILLVSYCLLYHVLSLSDFVVY